MLFNLFRRKKKKENKSAERKAMKPLTYSPKIILAWGEAITGNKEIRDWLTTNGYKELGLFSFALRNKDDAREWLMDNGYPHLMALINGAEGNLDAVKWLEMHKLSTLAKVALVGDGNEEAYRWLISNGHKDMALIAKKIQAVKDEIERDNNDIHKISAD
jgi:hypothetical protein